MSCGGKLVVGKAVEVGHIFKLGYKYSESMGARVLDPNGKEVTPIMGSYGIGIERILTAAIEQSNDANGFWLPASIAPFTVVVTVTNMADAGSRSTGEKLAAELEAGGLDVLLDDRDERAGVKFKDADLVGIPYPHQCRQEGRARPGGTGDPGHRPERRRGSRRRRSRRSRPASRKKPYCEEATA